MIDLSVIIPTHDRDSSLEALLLALEQQSFEPHSFEVIVAIDGQGTTTEALLQDLDLDYALRWLSGPQKGPGMARNRGAKAATGRLLLFLDDDMMPAPDLLSAHVQAHHDGVRITCLGQVRLLPGHALSSWEQYLNRHFELHYDKMEQAGYAPDFWDCLSGNLSIPRSLFLESQGFDPAFGEGKHEDIELGYRLNAMGVGFHYQSEALSYHRFAKSQVEGLRDGLLNGSSSLHFIRRSPELFPELLMARWRRYPIWFRQILRPFLLRASWRDCLTRQSAAALARVEPRHWPAQLHLPIYRLAYHLHFWQGLAQTAEPAELRDLLVKLSR